MIGRFKSIDPLWEKYYSLTPYQYSNNSPISMLDLDGMKIKVAPEHQEIFVSDMKQTFQDGIEFTFDSDNNLIIHDNRIESIDPTMFNDDFNWMLEQITDLATSDIITNVIYSGNIINPETGKDYSIGGIGYPMTTSGERAMTLLDVNSVGGENVTQNSIFVNPDFIHTYTDTKSGIEKYDPRHSNLIHGFGHVIFQPQAMLNYVIYFDNLGRSFQGQPKRDYDDEHPKGK